MLGAADNDGLSDGKPDKDGSLDGILDSEGISEGAPEREGWMLGAADIDGLSDGLSDGSGQEYALATPLRSCFTAPPATMYPFELNAIDIPKSSSNCSPGMLLPLWSHESLLVVWSHSWTCSAPGPAPPGEPPRLWAPIPRVFPSYDSETDCPRASKPSASKSSPFCCHSSSKVFHSYTTANPCRKIRALTTRKMLGKPTANVSPSPARDTLETIPPTGASWSSPLCIHDKGAASTQS